MTSDCRENVWFGSSGKWKKHFGVLMDQHMLSVCITADEEVSFTSATFPLSTARIILQTEKKQKHSHTNELKAFTFYLSRCSQNANTKRWLPLALDCRQSFVEPHHTACHRPVVEHMTRIKGTCQENEGVVAYFCLLSTNPGKRPKP